MKKYIFLFFIIICMLIITGCENDKNKDLTCTKIAGENEEFILKYSFKEGKVYLLDWTLTAPGNPDVYGRPYYERELKKFNRIPGCTQAITENNETRHTLKQVCDLSKMSDQDIQTVYSTNRSSLETTRKETLDWHEQDTLTKCE
ncbi:hypothetical protein I6G82_19485 [Lysinibacillus macroides]|uniref:Lipoprotein n=1 Tax=Lysinibacillus macroides TaxID=33935 RepID=A0A0N0UW59_9BACI|nr:hypothetical protein [Lysinibacillus macroides]KOY80084.1 hypothetical protein ADM90_23040 [Lysinibacillus macroides]QPR67373.1 hypothetical protein I6G82_19485 [Lysinibacillus macroides]